MSGAARTCVVCRESVGRDEALRFVVGPDGVAVVDWRHKLPGRGASVCWSRSCIEGVRQKGRLDRSFRSDVRLPGGDWPLGEARRWMARRQGELAGLAFRAGELKAGSNLVDRLLKRGWCTALLTSADVGETVAGDLERRARGMELPVFRLLLRSEELGAALGRGGARSVAALGRGPLVRSLRVELKRGLRLL